MNRNFLILALLLAGCAGQQALAPQTAHAPGPAPKEAPSPLDISGARLRLTPGTDTASTACPRFSTLKLEKKGKPLASHKLCGAQGMHRVKIGTTDVVFVAKVGDDGTGGGLYRYVLKKNDLKLADFNARFVVVQALDSTGAWLTVVYPGAHAPGAAPERRERWYWPLDKDAPEKQ